MACSFYVLFFCGLNITWKSALYKLTKYFFFVRSDFRSKFDVVSPVRKSIIWNNCKVRVNGEPIYYHNYKSSNIVLLSDLSLI